MVVLLDTVESVSLPKLPADALRTKGVGQQGRERQDEDHQIHWWGVTHHNLQQDVV